MDDAHPRHLDHPGHHLRHHRDAERLHPDPVPGHRGHQLVHPGLRGLLAAALHRRRLRLGLGYHPDAHHGQQRQPADLGGQQERDPLHLEALRPRAGQGRSEPTALAAPDRHRRSGPDRGRREHRLGHLRQRDALLCRRPQRDQRHRFRRVHRGLRPGHRGHQVGPTDRAAHHRGAGLRQRHGRLRRGQHLRGPERGQRPAALLLRAAGHHLRGGLGGPQPVLRGDPQRVGLRLRPQQRTHHAPRRPPLPDHPQPGQSRRPARSPARTSDRWACRAPSRPPTGH